MKLLRLLLSLFKIFKSRIAEIGKENQLNSGSEMIEITNLMDKYHSVIELNTTIYSNVSLSDYAQAKRSVIIVQYM